MLTSLAEPTGIGGGASGVQENAWTTIVRRVAHKVESAMVGQFDRRALAAMFPGRPALASFSLRTKQEKDVGAAVESISKLSAAGYQVDPGQVEAETGYKVTLKPAADPLPGRFTGMNRAVPGRTPLQNDENRLQNAPRDLDGQGDLPGENALVEALSGLFEKSLASSFAAGLATEDGERGTGKGESSPSSPKSPKSPGGEITQEQAEKLYEEMMAK